MATELTMPPLGEGIESADVLEVKVREGDTVKTGQVLAVVQAEKVTAELEANEPGRVAKVLVHNGDTLRVGQPYIALEAAEARPEAPRPQSAEAKREAPPPKPPAEKPKPPEGNGKQRAPEPRAATPDGVKAKPQAAAEIVPAGPATRQLARKLGLDLHRVHGSGRSGRITQEDVEAFVRELASGAKPQAAGVPVPELPDFSRWGAIERKNLDPIRRRTAQQMHLAWSVIPHVTQHDL